jgi:U3 small nucleolar RNA-associated protein 10
VLKALEIRVDQEKNTDADSRIVLLAFLPQLTAAIRDSSDIRYKHTAVACVDKIAEKYGKKDIEAVTAAAATIAGEHCLGQSDERLRIMALLCLSSLADVLQDAIVPILPNSFDLALSYLRTTLKADTPDLELHNACYSFFLSVAQHLPYIISGTNLEKIIAISGASAELDLDEEAVDSRKTCVLTLARQADPKTMFVSLANGWGNAVRAGFSV